MKTLNVYFTEAEYASLRRAKERAKYGSWHRFFLNLIKRRPRIHEKKNVD